MNLSPYIKAGYSILYLQSVEEARCEGNILATAKELKRDVRIWSYTSGFADSDGGNPDVTVDPQEALIKIKGEKPNTIFIMRDFHTFFSNPKILRHVRDIASEFSQQKKTMIIVSPVKKLAPEIERDVTVIEFDLPKKDEIQKIWNSLYTPRTDKIGKFSSDEHEKIVHAALGLTTVEAETAFAKAIVERASDTTQPISKLVMREK